MKRASGDTIQFESRAELGALLKAMETYMYEHKGEDVDEIKKLYSLLDVMEMEW